MTPLPPGSTIGILGGGQLGRMLALSAATLGYSVHIFAPEADAVAASVSAEHSAAAFEDEAALARFAGACDVVTYEFENVPAAPLAALGATPLFPPPEALRVAQDRRIEKAFVQDCGGRTAAFAPVTSAAELAAALGITGTPAFLKSARDGYDGKGQARIADPAGASAAWQAIGGAPAIVEAEIAFAAEFSVILARGQDGDMVFWDSPHNEHRGGMLAWSRLPAPAIVREQESEARDLARAVAERLGYVGVLTLEFFACADGPRFNEMAPRVHNSGHWTIEGAATSQFANHIRAIAGLPLGPATRTAAMVSMDNLIGDAGASHAALVADPSVHLHLYGKAEARAGRKMGHATRLGAAASTA